MSKNLAQIYAANPITTIGNTDVLYVVTTDTTDAAINGANLKALFLPSALTSSYLFVGNVSNIATGVPMSGDAALSNTGAITVSKIGGVGIVLAGAFTTHGAFTADFTFTAPTSVTFPSSGTLATTGGTVLNATNVATTQTSTNATYYPLFVASSTNSNQPCDLGTGLTFNPSTNALSTTTFIGALTGNATTSTTATNATNVATTQVSSNASYFPLMVASSTNSNQASDLATAFTYNPSTQTLTSTNFAGNASSATTSTTATNATNVATTQVSTNASYYPLFVASSTNGNQAADLGTGLTFNPSTNTLTTTTFSGALSGNASTATTISSIGATKLYGNSTGSPANGQDITIGTGLSFTGTTLNVTTASGFVWNDVSGTTQTAAGNNGYIISNAAQTTVTIPATIAEGQVIGIQGKGAAGWILQANTGQTIHFGSSATTSAGSLTSSNQWDSVQVVCVTANTTFAVISVIGNLTVA